MKRTATKLQSILLGLGLLLVLFAQPTMTTHAEAVVDHVVTHDSLNAFPVEAPCANDGAGETILFDGDMHSVAQYTGTADGFVNMIYNETAHWDGVGLTTGERYIGTSQTHSVTIYEHATNLISLRTSTTVISTGPEQTRLEFSYWTQLHIVNGEVVVDRVDFVNDCQ